MDKIKKTYLNWSSGKDASLSLYYLLRDNKYSVQRLLTSVNVAHDRISMHGIRRTLFEKQAKSIGIPLTAIELPEEPDMKIYNRKMKEAVEDLQSEGFTTAAFGDIFLEDLRKYREDQLNPLGIECIFPIWKKDTRGLMEEFIRLGFKAIVVAISENALNPSFLGREIDKNFLSSLPENVDPCGENGEFHTFCYDGPVFKFPVEFTIGEKVYKEYKAPKRKKNEDPGSMGFWFCDLI